MVDLLAQPKNRTLTAGFIVPLCEFLMVGGATFFVFPLVYLASSNSTAMQSLAGSLFLLSFFVNAPHFMHSYQLLYANYFGKVKEEKRFLSRLRYLHAGVIVPLDETSGMEQPPEAATRPVMINIYPEFQKTKKKPLLGYAAIGREKGSIGRLQ